MFTNENFGSDYFIVLLINNFDSIVELAVDIVESILESFNFTRIFLKGINNGDIYAFF